jgi:hypothetical protein
MQVKTAQSARKFHITFYKVIAATVNKQFHFKSAVRTGVKQVTRMLTVLTHIKAQWINLRFSCLHVYRGLTTKK